MSLDKTKFMLNDGDNTIMFLEHPNLNVYNYTFKKTLKINVNFLDKVGNKYDKRFYSGQTLFKNWVLENLEDKLSILVPYYDKGKFAYSRFQFDKGACGRTPKQEAKEFPVTTVEQKALSFLFGACKMIGSDINLFFLKRDENEVIALKLSENSTKLITIRPALTNTFADTVYTTENLTTKPKSSTVSKLLN